jgi:hypothetical protein
VSDICYVVAARSGMGKSTVDCKIFPQSTMALTLFSALDAVTKSTVQVDDVPFNAAMLAGCS